LRERRQRKTIGIPKPRITITGGFVLRFAGELGGFPRNGATAVDSPELM